MGMAKIMNTKRNQGLDLCTAAATLMYDVIVADGRIDELEVAGLVNILRERHSLETSEITEVVKTARRIATDEHSMEAFANELREELSRTERIDLVNDFWHLAVADRSIMESERRVIQRLSYILKLDEKDVHAAENEAETKLELNIA